MTAIIGASPVAKLGWHGHIRPIPSWLQQLSDPLFHGIVPRQGKPMGAFRKAWANAYKKAAVAGRIFHDLRRTAVRNMVRTGIDQTVAMLILGHRTDAVFERYNITSDDDLRAAQGMLEGYVSALPAESNLAVLESVG